jgi:hypothetical protein
MLRSTQQLDSEELAHNDTNHEYHEFKAYLADGLASFMGGPGGAEEDVMAVLEGLISLLEREAEHDELDAEDSQGPRASRVPM